MLDQSSTDTDYTTDATHTNTEQQSSSQQLTTSCCERNCAYAEQVPVKSPQTDRREDNCVSTPKPPQTHRPPSHDVTNHIFYLAGRCGVTAPRESRERLFAMVSWLYRDMAPVGAMQALLVSQIISTFLVAQTQLHASTSEADLQAINMRVGMASKLMKVMNLQLNLLATLKGMKVQSVKVEHLNVNGNSVIGIGGNVEQGGHRG